LTPGIATSPEAPKSEERIPRGGIDFRPFWQQMEVGGLDRSRPVSKAYRPSTALRPLAGPRALAKCQISVSPGVRQRHWSIQCQTSLFLDFRAAPSSRWSG
jgi:hypothetical protein